MTMIELQTRIEIDAPPRAVWAVLTDFEHYDEWNPLLVRAAGEAVAGSVLPMLLRLGPGLRLPLRMRVATVVPERELMWIGSAPLLLRGEHWFRIEARGERGATLFHGERFSGAIPGLLGERLSTLLQPSYEALNRALKVRAERTAAGA